jgi:hypothetical protein
MSDLRDAAARAAVWQVIEQAAKARKDEAKAELLALEQGDTIAGKVNGQVVGKASWSKGRTKLVVVDERALLAWLRRRHANEIVEAPNPAYLKALETSAFDGAAIDSMGEAVPGVELQTSDPYLTVRREKEAEQIVAGLLAHGRIELDGIRELTPRLDEVS